MRLIDADALLWRVDKMLYAGRLQHTRDYIYAVNTQPTIDAEPVNHGRWILKTNKEPSNYRWNVTAECSECCDEKGEIWGGFFPGVPDWLARDTALLYAKDVKISNYCPNCGAKMDGGNGDGKTD